MAQTGYTPIQLYYSSTTTNVPLAANLANGELAINITDGKLFYKDNSGVVQIIATKTGASATVSSVAQTFTGGIISVAGSPITTSGTLALTVAGTSGGIPYFSSASAWASSAALAANAIVLGGGAGAAPATTTTGTGVVTALGVNTGSAGAFVVNGGALGTPSSGTVTNLTGTASININGTVGATTPTTGVFTTVRAQAAATQDSMLLSGRAGGTSSYAVTLTPTTLTASRTVTFPDADINFTTGLPVANGGTGLTSGTSGGIPYFSSTSAIASSAALAASAIVLGGGAGAAPATTTTGTGVVTAIGNNVNTSGGLVTQSGTLAASALLLGGGSATAITSTTTGTGVVTALGNNTNATGGFPTIDGTATLTNKRITPRVSTTTSSATPTINTDNVDQYGLTAQAVDITSFSTNLSGTPTDGQKLWIYIVGTAARAITWGGSFESSTVSLPSTTVSTNRLDVGFVWNAATSKWRCVASA